jgi:transmembrane sensor
MEDRFHAYSSSTLAGEESFIRWVLHGEGADQWQQWIALHQDTQHTIEEARRIVLSLSSSPVATITQTAQNALWEKINTSITSAQKQPAKKNIRPLWIWGIAAAASLALLVWINMLTASQKVLALAGEQKEILLPEESVVSLNAGSSISFREKSFEADRVLHLEGEAFFKVKPGSTFSVMTENGTVTVLGTSFNVLSRGGRFEVSCYTGKVKVETTKKDQQIITTGELAIKSIEDESLDRDSFTLINASPEWTAGRFNFENQPLKEVIAELERQYAIKVRLDPALEELKYTGLFESGDLEKALYLITWPLHLKSTVKGNTVTLSR